MNSNVFAISPLRIEDKNRLLDKLSNQEKSEAIKRYENRLNDGAVRVEFINGMYVIVGNAAYFYACLQFKPKIVNIKINDQYDEVIKTNLILRANKEILNPMMSALIYLELKEICKLSQQQIAKRTKKTSGAISNKMRLLKLPENVQTAIIKNQIKERHGRAILQLLNTSDYYYQATRVLEEIITQNLKVSETENLVYSILGKKIVSHRSFNIKKLEKREELKHPEVGMVITKVSSELSGLIENLNKFFPNLELIIEDGIDKEDYIFLLKLKGINK